jgi:hypothetical protein
VRAGKGAQRCRETKPGETHLRSARAGEAKFSSANHWDSLREGVRE